MAHRAEPIAIIGMACRFPGGAYTPERFWQALRAGVDGIVEVPPDRWNPRAYYSPDPTHPGAAVTRWGGFIDQPVEAFDARFFGMAPREAMHLDPMHRWLLETAWEALEDAGLDPERLAGSRTGVFVGIFTEDVKLLHLARENEHLIGPNVGTGVAMTMASNRLSYWFDFQGPSMSVDTACSSSLVALHLACQSLRDGESTVALVGGANAMFLPGYTIAESQAGMLSPDGHCHAFDARANGYVRGEGAGMLVLKPLSRALADGDRVRALVLATALNQDGRTNGITVPNEQAQAALAREACARAGIEPRDVQYVEAHGTGTPVGDPAEARALGAVFGSGRAPEAPCLIGSVKANIGHQEAGAGVAGVMKAVLCLEHGEIPPQILFEMPNPAVDLEALGLRIARTVEPWPGTGERRIAAVNSFGFGGANAHALLAAAPAAAERAAAPERPELVVLSARSENALREMAAAYAAEVERTAAPLRDVAYTTARRAHLPHRLALVADSAAALREQLAAAREGRECAGVCAGVAPASPRRLGWVFSGMGPQWWGMGRELLAEEPVFRRAVEKCDRLFQERAGWSLLAEMLRTEADSRMAETQVAQPANFALQVGLAALLRSWDVEPQAIVGHSTGEAAAFHAAGVVDLAEAVRIIYHRSRLQQRTTGMGTMLAVALPAADASALIQGLEHVSLAAINSPTAVTLSGDPADLKAIAERLEAQGVFNRFLRVTVPFHSHCMDPLRQELIASLDGLAPSPATLPLYSTVLGGRALGTELDAAYWWRNVRDTVRFGTAIEAMAADGVDAFLEIGPHPVIAGSITESLPARAGAAEGVVASTLRRQAPERATLLGAVASLYVSGVPMDPRALHDVPGRVITLPTYPWQRERHWCESAASRARRLDPLAHPLLGHRLPLGEPAWETWLRSGDVAYLPDHDIAGAVVYPAAAYVEMAIAAAHRAPLPSEPGVLLEDVEFERALFLSDETVATVQTLVDPAAGTVTVAARVGEEAPGWMRVARARLAPHGPVAAEPGATLEAARARMSREMAVSECYRRLAGCGYRYGPSFRPLAAVWSGRGEALARVVAAPAVAEDVGLYHVHPTLLDGCFQTLLAAALPDLQHTLLPVHIERLAVATAQLGGALWVHATITDDARPTDGGGRSSLEGRIDVYGADGELRMTMRGVRAVALEGAGGTGAGLQSMLYDLHWEPVEPARAASDDGPGSWVILCDREGVGEALARRVQAAGSSAVLVRPGAAYRAPFGSGGPFELDPSRTDHWDGFWHAILHGNGGPPLRRLVHLWSLDTAPDPGDGGEELRAAVATGPLALLHALQALARAATPVAPRLWVVTRGAQAVEDADPPVRVAQAPMWGFARTVVHQELVEMAGGIVDLDARRDPNEVEALYARIAGNGAGEDQVALRGGRSYALRMVRSPAAGRTDWLTGLRPDVAYLVTGGLGGLGLLFARWLAARGARHLVLLGRTALPERAKWQALAPDSREGKLVAQLRAIEALGASVQVAALDVADAAAVARFVEQYAHEARPPIRGVLHAAGIGVPRMLDQIDDGEFQAGIDAKVLGSWFLHRALAAQPLDFFVFFSSVAAIGFSMGMSVYAAGNAFMDGLAQARVREGRRATSVLWGPWTAAGMATQEAVARDLVKRGFRLVTPEGGLAALDHVLRAQPTLQVVMDGDWLRLNEANYPVGVPPMLRTLVEGAAADRQPPGAGAAAAPLERLRAAADAERPSLLREVLRGLAARAMRFDPRQIDDATPLSTLGLDSIIAVELKNRIENQLHASPSIVEILRGGSIGSLAELLLPRTPLAETPAEAPAGESDLTELAEELSHLAPEEVELILHGGV